MNYYLEEIETPLGDLLLAVDEDGRLVRIDFPDQDGRAKAERALAGRGNAVCEDSSRTAAVADQLREYFDGRRQSFELEVAPRGSEFQLAVWDELTRIPYGETRSYGEVATAVRRPGAARAVGRAVGSNPISIVIPCHRVIGADGSLTGLGGGIDFKRGLLALETS
jgi:methylated-DNA-[protein]-cysteine S-methyltransferase